MLDEDKESEGTAKFFSKLATELGIQNEVVSINHTKFQYSVGLDK